jgi:hypothetical protein
MSTTLNAYIKGGDLAIRVHSTVTPRPRALRIAFLLDVSDSMYGENLTAVKKTLAAAGPLLQSDDLLTLITFGDHAHLSLLEGSISDFFRVIDTIDVNGCTNMSAAFDLLYKYRDIPFDGIILLTDGIVNRGLTRTTMLREMALEIGNGSIPYATIGYGADHNRQLLSDISVATHGSYTYADSDEVLPTAIGDILSGLRNQVHRHAILTVDGNGWFCQEIGSGDTHVIGGIVAEREYWAVFKGAEGAPPPTVQLIEGGRVIVSATAVVHDSVEVTEQVLRVRVAHALKGITNQLENGTRVIDMSDVEALNAELEALPEETRRRPLIRAMRGELCHVIENKPKSRAAHIMAHLVHTTAVLSSQRGMLSQTMNDDPHNLLFSSPTQVQSAMHVRGRFSEMDPTE